MTETLPRVLFMGTPDFAVPALQALAGDAYRIAAVVTQPDRPQGRRRKLTPSPVKLAAQALGLPVLQPEKVRSPAALAQVAALLPDVLVTAAYGQLLPQRLLDLPRVGCINVHASLLPRWRGAAPIHRALLAGDTETGVTLMEMVAALDAGPILRAQSVPILEEDNVGSLHDRLAQVGASLLQALLPCYLAGEVAPTAQPDSGVTYAARIGREDEWVDWTRSVHEVYNQIRGLSPWPGATTRSAGRDLKVWAAQLVKSTELLPDLQAPGTLCVVNRQVLVSCQDGWMTLTEVQPAGKRKMSAVDWLHANAGEKLVLETAPNQTGGSGQIL